MLHIWPCEDYALHLRSTTERLVNSGRISSSNLKWNFSLGASIGVSSSPAKAEINPSIEYERDTVVGTMMKM